MTDLEVVFSPNDMGKLPKGCNNNKPLYRKKKILSTITKFNNKFGQQIRLVTTEQRSPLHKAEIIHCPKFLTFLTNGYEEWLQFGAERDINFFYKQEILFTQKEEEISCAGEEGFVPAQSAPRADNLQRPGKSVLSQICYFALDRFTPLFSDTRETLESDLHVVELAFNRLKNGDAKRIYALTTQPGHHSGRDWYGGYCYVNLGAYCTSLLEQEMGKVAHIDIDYHAGNGTMSLFWENANVFFASLHCDPHFDYPFNTGFEDQIGGENAEYKTLNIPLPPKTEINSYLTALRRVKDEVIKHGAKALVVSLGVDTLEGDYDASPQGGFSIKLPDFSRIGDEIISFDLPTIYVQEGGYVMSSVGEAVLRALIGSSFDPSPLSH